MSVPAHKSMGKLIEMDIADFLKMAKHLAEGPNDYKLDKLRTSLGAGHLITELPLLMVDSDRSGKAQVDGHEGRHRALVLKELGFTSMPVILKMGGLRWSEQSDPERFDYQENWPTRLVGEQGLSIPFPVARKDAMSPYK